MDEKNKPSWIISEDDDSILNFCILLFVVLKG
jgi:hypothetical protein